MQARHAYSRPWRHVLHAGIRAADLVERLRRALVTRFHRLKPIRRRALLHGALIGGYVGFVLLVLRGTDPFAWDAYAYWSLDLADLYGGTYGTSGYFPYSPAAALLFAPASLVPWPIFAVSWTGLLLLTLVWLGGRASIFLLAFTPIAGEIYTGNIHLLLAAAMVLGFRWPAAWALVLLTKITPGVGLVWFAVRREWRSLGIALGVTAAIAAVSFVILPTHWATWVATLFENSGAIPQPVPIWARLPIAALVVAWGALKNAPWTVPIAAVIAAPVIFFVSLSMLAACWPLRHGLPERGSRHGAVQPATVAPA